MRKLRGTNGNIIRQVRKDDANATIDDMNYYYEAQNGTIDSKSVTPGMKVKRNRLRYVNDATNYDANDIDPGMSSGNYAYDAEGRLVVDVQEKIDRITWRVDGKVRKIERPVGATQKNLIFDYDAMGHRIAKHVYNSGNIWEKSIYYVLDAQGNTMSVYEHANDDVNHVITFAQTEKHIYGSARLGTNTEKTPMFGSQNTTYSIANVRHRMGERTYELTNHLGNVLSVVSDKVLPVYDQTTIYSNDFSSGLGGFINDPGVVLSLVSGQLQVSNVPTHYCTRLSLNSLTTVGHSYKVRFKIDLNGSGPVSAYAAISSTIFGIVNCSSNGTYEFTYTPTATTFTNLYLRFESMGGAVSPRTFYIDDVSIEDITVTGYLADIRQSTDYSPFGVILKNRDLSLTSGGGNVPYRYGFQNQERDDEIKGAGNSINFEYRMHDPRIGRFFAIDPLASKYPYNSPYAFSENRVIDKVELEGLEAADYDERKAEIAGKIKKYNAISRSDYQYIIDQTKERGYVLHSELVFFVKDPKKMQMTDNRPVPEGGMSLNVRYANYEKAQKEGEQRSSVGLPPVTNDAPKDNRYIIAADNMIRKVNKYATPTIIIDVPWGIRVGRHDKDDFKSGAVFDPGSLMKSEDFEALRADFTTQFEKAKQDNDGVLNASNYSIDVFVRVLPGTSKEVITQRLDQLKSIAKEFGFEKINESFEFSKDGKEGGGLTTSNDQEITE